MRILIIDDSKYARNLIKSYLLELAKNWDLIEAESGDAGFAILEKTYQAGGIVDLILLDWNLPNMLGIEFLKKLKTDAACEAYKDIKVIIVTSDGDKANVIESVKSGASGFLVKPVDPDNLKEKIFKLFD
ncbi:MAG: response regulator [Spirochaetaceae bacterium]|nr:response regulator [Spirochaetaceae bacterium]